MHACTQGPIHFDENGIRHVNAHELRVLQYRTTYMNGTPIASERGQNTSLSNRLKLVEVAHLDNGSLKFPVGNKNSVWPGTLLTKQFSIYASRA